MKKFLADFGFEVIEGSDQLLPLFNHKRGARVSRGNLRFQLEESDDRAQKATFNLFLTDFSDEEIQRIKSIGYEHRHKDTTPYGEFHTFHTPDGGTIIV
ncbi:MAG: hypothetical protein AB1705_16505 [Verrucomicrobiota bacterium]